MLEKLRKAMKTADIDMLLIPSADPHGSEYPEEYFKARKHFSGFTGSAGTLLIWQGGAGLWTDGRYFLQAERQLEGSGIDLFKMREPGVPTVDEFIAENIKGGVLGADLRTISASEGMELEKGGAILKDCRSLIDGCWEGRPELSREPAYVLPMELAGVSSSDKLGAVRAEMARCDANACIFTDLADIAWLFNIRGNDVKYLPVALSYAIVEKQKAYVFMDAAKAAPIAAHLKALDTEILPYDAIYEFIGRYGEKDAVMCALSILNYKLYQGIARCRVVDTDPVQLMKAVKNPVELENFRKTHIKDGVAVTRFMHWAKTHAKEGYTEMQAADALEGFRKEQEGYMYPSFETIAGYGPHGAIVHYSATPETDIPVKPEGLLLVDSGGQYMGGTTDITRTIALGPLTKEEKQAFTIVLESMLALLTFRFPKGCAGFNLDAIARAPFWSRGMDYNHGTGHGVGYMLSVHEGPNGIRGQRRVKSEDAAFAPGMITSDEPGIYIEGKYGVRHENLMECVEAEPGSRYLEFRSITFAPIDLDAIDEDTLTEATRRQLNAYHKEVYAKLAPNMREEELSWLREYTREI